MKLKKFSGTTPAKGKRKRVEQQLFETAVKLTEAEINISLFSKMIRNGIATNDVYNFVRTQTGLRKSSNKLDHKLLRVTMRQKLNDACAYAHRLRRKKKDTIVKILNKHKENKGKAWNLSLIHI